MIKVFYNGKKESKPKILEILVTEFKSDFEVISFTQPKISQLEKIYTELIIDDEPKIKLKTKEVE